MTAGTPIVWCLCLVGCVVNPPASLQSIVSYTPPFSATQVTLPEHTSTVKVSPTGRLLGVTREMVSPSGAIGGVTWEALLLDRSGKALANLGREHFESVKFAGWGRTDDELYLSSTEGVRDLVNHPHKNPRDLLHWKLDLRRHEFKAVDEIPRWSPDRKSYVSETIEYDSPPWTGWRSFIYIINPQTKHRRLLAEGMTPQWSPDGKWIAYWGKDDPGGRFFEEYRALRIIRPDGSGSRVVFGGMHLDVEERENYLKGAFTTGWGWLTNEGVIIAGARGLPEGTDERLNRFFWVVDIRAGRRKFFPFPLQPVSASLDGKHLLVKVENKYYLLDFMSEEK